MSLAALARRAAARRDDPAKPAKDAGEVREAGPPTPPPPPQSSNVADTAKQIAEFVPTEIITLYAAALAITTNNSTEVTSGQVVAFAGLLVATPVIVWVLYATFCRAQGKELPLKPRVWPWQEMTIASTAFVVWAGMLPATPFKNFSWYTAELGGFVGLVFTVAVGLVTPLLPGTIKTGNSSE